jgi:hypothetical protein
MAVVDYKNAVEYNGTILKNSILKLVRIKFLLNMVMLGLNSIIFPKKVLVNASYQWFANFE